MKTLMCQQCGQPYEVKAYMAVRSRFCGMACYGAWQKAHPRPKPDSRIAVACHTCGKEVRKYRSALSPVNFCSRACFAVWRGSDAWRGENCPAWLGGGGDYRGQNWAEQRAAALARDGHTCQDCGARGVLLHVHHRRPFQLFADYQAANDLANLVSLCERCHGLAEVAFWRANPNLIGARQFPSCTITRACRTCGGTFQPRSAATKVCDACCNATCEHCGAGFYSRKAVHRAVKYCSRDCRNAAVARPAHNNPRRKSSPTT